jgi:diguanylate cyclase (GGDEF)-like protein
MDQPDELANELGSASWSGAAPFHVPVQRALGTAKAQLGLRRQLRQQPDAVTANVPAAVYPVVQLAEALEELARTFSKPGESAPLLDAEAIGRQVIGALGKRGVAPAAIAPEQQEIIEVMVNVLGALLQDPRIADIAKANISRLQAVAHKAAVLDEQFFNDDKHPVRQLLDRIAEVRPAMSALHEEQLDQKVSAIIRTAEQRLDGDPAELVPVLDELNALLEEQRQDYQDNVVAVVQTSVDQQKMLKEHREKAGLAASSSASRQSQSPEWERWLRRARALAEGDRFQMNANTPQPSTLALVWVGEDSNPFVFVDQRGLKALTLTLEQVAMNLRRGVLKPLLDNATPAVERALSGVVEQFHEEIAEQAGHDELTGLLTRKGFLAAIEKRLTLAAQVGAPPVLVQLAVTNLKALNDEHGDEVGNEVLRTVARYLSDRYSKKTVLVGRVGGGAFGLYWDKAIVWTISEEIEQVIKELVALSQDHDGRAVTLRFAAGLLEVAESGARAEQLWNTVVESCAQGEANPDKPVVVAGAENRHQEQLKQITSYVQKAVQRERLVLLFHEARAVRSERPPLVQMAVSAADRKGKLIPPALFAHAAASSALAWDVDLWLVREALRWMQTATTDSERLATVVLPLSGASLVREGLASVILELLMETAVPPARLCFSLINRDAVAHLAETAELVNTLREFGCRFMLDEFGGGQGDYAHVRELAVDYVCLQRAVIDEARRNPKDYAMAKSVNELAHFMGKLTLARQTASDPLDQWAKELGIDLILDQTRMTRLKTDKK